MRFQAFNSNINETAISLAASDLLMGIFHPLYKILNHQIGLATL